MTPQQTLEATIGAAWRDASCDPRPALDDPEVLALAKAEITRLRANGKRRVLAETDAVSKVRCETLERLIRDFEGG